VNDLNQLWPPQESDPLFDLMIGAGGFFLEYRSKAVFDALTVLDRAHKQPWAVSSPEAC
jgi:hypothetical protein